MAQVLSSLNLDFGEAFAGDVPGGFGCPTGRNIFGRMVLCRSLAAPRTTWPSATSLWHQRMEPQCGCNADASLSPRATSIVSTVCKLGLRVRVPITRLSAPKSHNRNRSPRKFASQRVLRGLCGGLFEGSAGSPRGSAGVCRSPWDFPRAVTLSLWPWGTVGHTARIWA